MNITEQILLVVGVLLVMVTLVISVAILNHSEKTSVDNSQLEVPAQDLNLDTGGEAA